jgi:hypothetical protein
MTSLSQDGVNARCFAHVLRGSKHRWGSRDARSWPLAMGSRNPGRDAPILSDPVRLADLARDYPFWELRICCRAPGCIHCGDVSVRQLLKRKNPPCCLRELKRRAWCTRCKRRGQAVVFARYVGGGLH